MWSKISIHPTCYFFLFISVITGNFITVFLCSILLLGHECGHFFTALLLGWETDKISFYPFGGISKFHADVNRPLKEEILVLIMGPFVQCILFFLFSYIPFIASYFDLLKTIHYHILIFNLLPIYPLDGGRILQCFSCYLISYYYSFTFIYVFSYFLLFLFVLFLIKYPNFNIIIVVLMLFIRLFTERKQIKYYFQKFLLERYLHIYHFKNSKVVSSDKGFKRDYYHLIKEKGGYTLEKEYLQRKYKI